MKTANLAKPPTGALRFVASLMGRMDRALAELFAKSPGAPKFNATKPFHKPAGYVKRERLSAGAQRKQRAAEARVANMAKVAPKPVAERKRTPHEFRQHADGGSYTLTGRNTPVRNRYGRRIVDWVTGRRVWGAGVSAHQEIAA